MAKGKIVSFSKIGALASRLRAKKKRIVFTNGCFDIIHAGHVNYLEKAKRLGDILIVGLNSDSSVKKIKGPKRPIVNQDDRAIIVSALESVDYVSIFNEPTPLKLIKAVKPDILVKGADWRLDSIVGADFVKSYGGKVKSVALVKGRSSSNIIHKVASRFK